MTALDVSDVIIPNKEIWISPFGASRVHNMYPQVQGIDIYESLDNFSLTADFFLEDSIELINNLPIAGEEEVEITIQTPSRPSCTYKLFVESIQGMKTNDMSNIKKYKLRCVTKDFLKNSWNVYSKRYKDMNYDAAVNAILKDELVVSKEVVVDPTKGKFDYVVNNIRPFQAVDLIKERAVSPNYKSSIFLFWEDWEKYYFKTFEAVIEERKGKAEDFVFTYDETNRQPEYGSPINVRNILAYETITQGASVDKVMAGTMRNQYREFDIFRGTYYTMNEYNNTGQHTNYKFTDANEDMNSSKYSSFVTSKPGVTKMAVKDSLRPEMEHNTNIHWKRGFENRMYQYGMRIRVYGDTALRVGDMVKAKVPDISGVTVEPKQQELYSENYVVRTLRHRLDKRDNAEFEHFMILDIRKPNMKKAI